MSRVFDSSTTSSIRSGYTHKQVLIRFDIRNDIKIFDFGLAKELKPIEREGKDEYETSGLAGTRRYMAPEVAEELPPRTLFEDGYELPGEPEIQHRGAIVGSIGPVASAVTGDGINYDIGVKAFRNFGK